MVTTCIKCILDTNDDPLIFFDSNGICNHCITYEINISKFYKGNEKDLKTFKQWINKVKIDGKHQKYDIIIGLSGGVDSTYVAYLCWKFGVRALAVHMDNGWNSELSVVNIKNILKVTGFDLYTYVINWKEFRDLQRSYFKANVVDIEALTDHAVASVLRNVADKFGIKYIFNGSSITTEGRLPSNWIHNKSDSINILGIHKKYGELKIKTFPLTSIWKKMIFKSKVRSISILDFYPYNKPEAKDIIIKEFSWRDYGGKHYESIFTRFYQAYILPKKFKIDKRKSHYSTLICAGQLKRENAIESIKQDTYFDKNLEMSDYSFVIKKLGFTEKEFDDYINHPPVSHLVYGSIENYRVKLKPFYVFFKRLFSLYKRKNR